MAAARSQDLVEEVSGDKKEAVLRSLAYAMMERRVVDMNREAVLEEIGPALRRMPHDVTPDGFLADVSTNGLLIERETGQYAFAHKTIQEYLAAAYIQDKGLVTILVDAVNDDWWAETTLLYATKSNADPIVRACLDADSVPALALALDCTDRGSEVDPDLRERVNLLVRSAAEPDADPERRRLFSGILLRRYMRRRIWIRGGGQICPRLIPESIYQLFLADTKTPEPDAPPTAHGVVVGMRSRDAAAFVHWANAVSGGQHDYRLPLPGELDDLAAQQQIPALPSGRLPKIWVNTEDNSAGALPVLWMPPEDSEYPKSDNVSLFDSVRQDVASSEYTFNRLSLLRSRVLVRVLLIVLAISRTSRPSRPMDLHFDEFELSWILEEFVGLGIDLGVPLDLIAAPPSVDRALDQDLDRVLDLDLDLALGLDVDLHVERSFHLDLALALDRALSPLSTLPSTDPEPSTILFSL